MCGLEDFVFRVMKECSFYVSSRSGKAVTEENVGSGIFEIKLCMTVLKRVELNNMK